jgi:hypothetical protein
MGRTRNSWAVVAIVAVVGALAVGATSASAFTSKLKFPLENWAVSGSLTDKKLNEPVVLPKGSAFNGEALITLTETEAFGTMAGNLTVPPFHAKLKLAGLVPTEVGVTLTQVEETQAEILAEPRSDCVTSPSQWCVKVQAVAKANIGLTMVGVFGLEVPTHCETTEPVDLPLSSTLTFTELQEVGPRFSGTATIPSIACEGLSGIVVGPLVTAVMSGPDNPFALHIGPYEPAAPSVETSPASGITQVSGVVRATVNPNTEPVGDCHFEYGTSPSYGTSIPCSSSPGSGSNREPVKAQLTGLNEETTYHFRIVATNPLGTSYGGDESFTTLGPAAQPEYFQCVSHVGGLYKDSACSVRGKKGKYELAPGPAPTCVAQPKGEYVDSSCSTKSKKAKKGTYEKAAGPGFTSTSGSAALEGSGLGAAIVCSGGTGVGEITGKISGAERLTLTGCEASGKRCRSEGANSTPSGAAGEIVTNLLKTRLLATVGEDWTELTSGEHEPYLAELGCEGSLVRIKGSVSGGQGINAGTPSFHSNTVIGVGTEQGLVAEVSEDGGKSWAAPGTVTAKLTLSNTYASATALKP